MDAPQHRPLAPRRVFLRRFARNAAIAGAIVFAALVVGIVGYHVTEGLNWLDSFLNASMILSGMGPAQELKTSAGKIFAGCYALFSGVMFITGVGVLFAPVVHRFLHKFHLDLNAK